MLNRPTPPSLMVPTPFGTLVAHANGEGGFKVKTASSHHVGIADVVTLNNVEYHLGAMVEPFEGEPKPSYHHAGMAVYSPPLAWYANGWRVAYVKLERTTAVGTHYSRTPTEAAQARVEEIIPALLEFATTDQARWLVVAGKAFAAQIDAITAENVVDELRTKMDAALEDRLHKLAAHGAAIGELAALEQKPDLNLAENFWGPLDGEIRARLKAVLERPSEETWEDAHSIILQADGTGFGLTLWQAVIAVDPSFTRTKPCATAGSGRFRPKFDAAGAWPEIPTSDLIDKALRYALSAPRSTVDRLT